MREIPFQNRNKKLKTVLLISKIILGPSANTLADTKILNGQIVQPSSNFGVPATSATQCLQDSFRIPGLPLICGENSGEHGMNNWPCKLQITTLIIEYFVEKCNNFQFNQSESNWNVSYAFCLKKDYRKSATIEIVLLYWYFLREIRNRHT